MVLPDLKIGTIFAIFNLSGTVPVMKEWFIMWARGVEISLIVLRIMLVEMLSTPVLYYNLAIAYDNYVDILRAFMLRVDTFQPWLYSVVQTAISYISGTTQ